MDLIILLFTKCHHSNTNLKMFKKNKQFDEFNGLLSSKYNDHASGKFVIRQNELFRYVPRVNNSVAHYNQKYHDNVHLNYRRGIPYLKNILLQLLKTSNGAVNNMSSNVQSQSYKMLVRSNSHYSTNLYGGNYYQHRSNNFYNPN